MKSCFLFGHSTCPLGIMPQLEKVIEIHYTQFYIRDFYVGNRGSFDQLAATAVKRVKVRHPDLRLYLLLAYHPAERPVYLPDGFDGSFYPPLENVPRQYAIVRANQYMLDTSDSVICYVKYIGNSRNLLEYVQRRIKKGAVILENLAEDS